MQSYLSTSNLKSVWWLKWLIGYVCRYVGRAPIDDSCVRVCVNKIDLRK